MNYENNPFTQTSVQCNNEQFTQTVLLCLPRACIVTADPCSWVCVHLQMRHLLQMVHTLPQPLSMLFYDHKTESYTRHHGRVRRLWLCVCVSVCVCVCACASMISKTDCRNIATRPHHAHSKNTITPVEWVILICLCHRWWIWRSKIKADGPHQRGSVWWFDRFRLYPPNLTAHVDSSLTRCITTSPHRLTGVMRARPACLRGKLCFILGNSIPPTLPRPCLLERPSTFWTRSARQKNNLNSMPLWNRFVLCSLSPHLGQFFFYTT